MPFAQLMAVLPLRDVACSLRVPSNSNDLKCNKDENETVIAHRSDCGLFLFRQKKGVRQWMSNSKLIELSYYDPSAQVRLSAYADTLVLDHDQNGSIISAIRFGGYPEMVRAMADAIYGGATIEAAQNDTTRMLQSSLKSYQRQITHDGIYAVATLMAADTVQEDDRSGKHEKDEDTNLVDTEQMELQPRRCYIFCPARDQKRLFEELDHKTAAPLIPEFQDYVLSSLRQRGDLRQLEVISLKERIDAWVLDLKPQDQNVLEQLERLGIPVLVETSSYETQPMGRMEWIKLYAALLDKEDEAEALFNEKMDSVADVLEQQPTGKTVAFFYITSSGAVNVRKSTDYVAKCVAIAGGDYVSFDESAEDNAQSTINIQMESFYHGAVDADVLIYNSIIDGELHTLDELVALDPLMADFKAVKSGNVWCLTKNFYQESLELSDLILDVNHALNDAPDTAFHFLTRMK